MKNLSFIFVVLGIFNYFIANVAAEKKGIGKVHEIVYGNEFEQLEHFKLRPPKPHVEKREEQHERKFKFINKNRPQHSNHKREHEKKTLGEIMEEVYGKDAPIFESGYTPLVKREHDHEKKFKFINKNRPQHTNHKREQEHEKKFKFINKNRPQHNNHKREEKKKTIGEIMEEVYGKDTPVLKSGYIPLAKREQEHEKKFRFINKNRPQHNNHRRSLINKEDKDIKDVLGNIKKVETVKDILGGDVDVDSVLTPLTKREQEHEKKFKFINKNRPQHNRRRSEEHNKKFKFINKNRPQHHHRRSEEHNKKFRFINKNRPQHNN